MQRIVDRRFNRARYNAEAITVAFAHQMRDQTDIDAVRQALATAVNQTVAPAHISLLLCAEPVVTGAGPRGPS